MDIDGALVMTNFLSMMGNFFVAMGFCAIITLAITSMYVFFVHHRGDDFYGE
jgi:hypothetical protein